jgi:DinB superfamily
MPVTLPADTDPVTMEELRRLTNTVLDSARRLLRRCTDFDVTFVPLDPLADDPYAEAGHEVNVGWTLSHIIAHVTAGAEESAALAAELARGVAYHGRSRNEVPWESMKTVGQCKARIDECRRLCLASLGMWPAQPDLTNTYIPWEDAAPMGATARYLLGLRHGVAHLVQMEDAVAQARAERRRRSWWGRLRTRLGRRAGGDT